jgi:hypothetical protein
MMLTYFNCVNDIYMRMTNGICPLALALCYVMLCCLDFYIRRPPSEVKDLNSQKVGVKIQLAAVKSIQLEFVKHSLLSRNMIKLDKQLAASLGMPLPTPCVIIILGSCIVYYIII